MPRQDIHRPRMRAKPQPNIRLPVEVIGVIGECLLGAYQFGTLAKLNQTCKAVRTETLPVLYETLTWDNEFHAKQREWWVEVFQGNTGQGGLKFPEGWKYTSGFVGRQPSPAVISLSSSSSCLLSRIPVPRNKTTSVIRQTRLFRIQPRRDLPRPQVVHLTRSRRSLRQVHRNDTLHGQTRSRRSSPEIGLLLFVAFRHPEETFDPRHPAASQE